MQEFRRTNINKKTDDLANSKTVVEMPPAPTQRSNEEFSQFSLQKEFLSAETAFSVATKKIQELQSILSQELYSEINNSLNPDNISSKELEDIIRGLSIIGSTQGTSTSSIISEMQINVDSPTASKNKMELLGTVYILSIMVKTDPTLLDQLCSHYDDIKNSSSDLEILKSKFESFLRNLTKDPDSIIPVLVEREAIDDPKNSSESSFLAGVLSPYFDFVRDIPKNWKNKIIDNLTSIFYSYEAPIEFRDLSSIKSLTKENVTFLEGIVSERSKAKEAAKAQEEARILEKEKKVAEGRRKILAEKKKKERHEGRTWLDSSEKEEVSESLVLLLNHKKATPEQIHSYIMRQDSISPHDAMYLFENLTSICKKYTLESANYSLISDLTKKEKKLFNSNYYSSAHQKSELNVTFSIISKIDKKETANLYNFEKRANDFLDRLYKKINKNYNAVFIITMKEVFSKRIGDLAN